MVEKFARMMFRLRVPLTGVLGLGELRGVHGVHAGVPGVVEVDQIVELRNLPKPPMVNSCRHNSLDTRAVYMPRRARSH